MTVYYSAVRNPDRLGYLLFAASGIFFIIIGIRERDVLTLIAAALWMAGCGVFLRR